MKIPAHELAAEAAWMAKLPNGSGLNPAASSVQLSAVLGALQLRRTDFEQFRESVIPANGVGQATIVVEAANLAAQLRKATRPAVIDFEDEWLSIGLSDRTVRLRATGAEMPAWPEFVPTAEPSVVTASQVTRVLAAVGTDDLFPMLTVVAFDNGAMVTTDRFRLARIAYAKSGFNAMVPGLVLRAFTDSASVITVEPGAAEGIGKAIRVSSGGRSIVAPMPDVQFPKWRTLIPEQVPISILVRRDDLIAAASRADMITLTVKDNNTMLACATSNDGDVEVIQEITATVIDNDIDRLPFEASFNARYMAATLRACGSGAVRFGATDPGKPVVFEDVGKSDLHLLMPIRK